MIKDLIAHLAFIATAFWVALNFFFICVNGQTVIGQENLIYNSFEFAVSLGILALSIERYIHFLRGK